MGVRSRQYIEVLFSWKQEIEKFERSESREKNEICVQVASFFFNFFFRISTDAT